MKWRFFFFFRFDLLAPNTEPTSPQTDGKAFKCFLCIVLMCILCLPLSRVGTPDRRINIITEFDGRDIFYIEIESIFHIFCLFIQINILYGTMYNMLIVFAYVQCTLYNVYTHAKRNKNNFTTPTMAKAMATNPSCDIFQCSHFSRTQWTLFRRSRLFTFHEIITETDKPTSLAILHIHRASHSYVDPLANATHVLNYVEIESEIRARRWLGCVGHCFIVCL